MSYRRALLGVSLGLLLMLAACGPQGAEEAAPAEAGVQSTESSQVAEADTPTPEAVEIVTATPEEPAATEDDATDSDAIDGDTIGDDAAGDEAEETGTEESEAAGADEAVVESTGQALTVEAALPIERYRQRIRVMGNTGRGMATVEMENDYTKSPSAQHSRMNIEEGDGENVESYSFEYIFIDGTTYVFSGDTWVQTPGPAINVREVTLILPEDVVGLPDQMEQLGAEEVEGRSAIHYRGDKEMIPTVGTAGDTLDVSRADSAQIDLWVDQEFNALTKLELTGSELSAGQEVTFTVSIVYYDLNGDITIAPPEEAMGAGEEDEDAVTEEDDAASDAADPINEVSALLGFDFMLPTGSIVQMHAPGSLVVVSTPYTVAEAANLIEMRLPENGYQLMTQTGDAATAMIYTFQQGEQIVAVTIAPNDADGGSILQFAAQ